MKKLTLKLAALLGASAFFSFAAFAATNMLGAAGITSPAASTCPTTLPGGSPQCASGWFNINGAKDVVIDVTASAGTNTVVIQRRSCATCPTSTLKTLTNASATEVPNAIYPPSGWVRLNVSAVSGGTVKGTITSNSVQGVGQW